MDPQMERTETPGEPTPDAYEAPVLTVLGSVEAITLSNKRGSFSDFRGRRDRRRVF